MSAAHARLLVFFASGFAGLIYESIWTHYLKLFLGHAAYAQTLVLAIFMGGMAIGASLAARRTERIARPWRAYAAVEAVVGVLAWVFHPVYTGSTEGFYDIVLARHLDGQAFVALKWALATLLILPQSVLLGATFPLFAAAATRADTPNTGRTLATLYFANSLGGALGVLVCGFVFVPRLGLPATMALAGTLNLAIAGAVLRLSFDAVDAPGPAPVRSPPARAPLGRLEWLLLAVAMLTGASSFVYEVAWIRMLSLVLGSATHAFELMLSSFIFGLALGGLWVRPRIDRSAQPGVLLGHIQIAMGCAALATVPLHSASFELVAWGVQNAPKTDTGYALFNLLRYGVASLIMFPAAFCAGMTLPLATRILYARPAQGERAIGFVYGANTLGAIAGLAFAVHVGLPMIGLEYLVASGALVDVALGVLLLAVFGGRTRLRRAGLALLGSVAATWAVAATFDPRKLASGVYRTGQSSIAGRVLGLAHGKTATISVERSDEALILRTNGKPDASVRAEPRDGYRMDEVTMALIGAVPLMLHAQPRRVANIGFGAGITGDVILGDARVAQLDTIEIEPQVVALARHFAAFNARIYEDPRSAVHVDDAKSFFSAHAKRYDLIVSEPSNPWVSGVAGLFSVEFYRHVRRHLDEGGLFAQWLQVYETHPERASSVLKAIGMVFDDYLVIALDQSDVLIVASPRGRVALPPDAFDRLSPGVRDKLRRIGLVVPSDITQRIIGNRRMFAPWLDASPAPANSDYAPYLDSHAEHDRFVGSQWLELVTLAGSAYPMAELLGARPPLATPSAIGVNPHFGPQPAALVARQVAEQLLGPAPASALPIPGDLPPQWTVQGRDLLAACARPPLGDRGFAAAALGIQVLPYLSPDEGRRVLSALAGAECMTEPPGTSPSWPTLLRGLTERDAAGFGALAEAMLGNGAGGTEVRSRYLLGMALLGHLANGQPAGALAAWNRHASQVLQGRPPGLALELLHAQASTANAGR